MIKFFTKEHLFSNLITLLVIILGGISLNSIRRDIWPKVDLHITTISALLPGASPEQVEKLVVNPIEAALKEIDGLKKVHSKSTESTGVVIAELDADARSPEKTNADIQRAVDQINEFPEETSDPTVNNIDSGVMPILEVTVSGDLSDVQLRDTAKTIYDELSLVREVAKVTKQGYRKKEFLVEASPQKLAARNVPLRSLLSAIAATNVSLPAGSLKDNDGMETLARTESQYTTAHDIEQTYILTNSSGYGTQIKDVAHVEETLAEPDIVYHANGKKSVNLVVSKKENADALNLVKKVKEKVLSLSHEIPAKVQLGISNDFSIYLSKRLAALTSNLLIGLILVVLILIFFLPWRVTLIVSMGIPIALLATLSTAYLTGLSLNLISLVGLIIVLGMLVDDAIVVSENIWRHVEQGDVFLDSIVKGTKEVVAPVIASALTTVSAFAPMLFMTGIFGAFIFEIPLMVILALVFSLLEVFFIMPAHFMSWVGERAVSQTKKEHWFDPFAEKYAQFIAWSLKRRYKMLGAIIFIFIGTLTLLITTGRFVLFPGEGVEIIFAQVEAPLGVSVEKMEALITPIEKKIHETLDSSLLLDTTTSIGIIQQDAMDPLTRRGPQYANIRMTLTPYTQRDLDAQQIIDLLRKNIGLPKDIAKIDYEQVRSGPPQGRPISMNLVGKDYNVLSQMTEAFKKELEKIPGIQDVRDSYQFGKEEWQVIPRLYDTSIVGLTPKEIATGVRASFEGIVASSVRNLDEQIDIRVKLKNDQNQLQNKLNEIKIGNNQGNLIPLKNIADFKPTRALSYIAHSNYKRIINISANVDESKITALAANKKIIPILNKLLQKHPGYSYESSGEDKDTQDSMASLLKAFAFAALFIFALLIMTFRDLLQPLLVLTSIPLGFIGVVWAMFIHGRPLSFMAMLGVIALAGVIVNNAIVFTDFVNLRRREGLDLNDSVIDAARTRLRPIVLTSMTTICGLLPTAYGNALKDIFNFGGGDPFIIPIALALGWGLAIGSVLTTVFFPSFLRILDDIRNLRRSKS